MFEGIETTAWIRRRDGEEVQAVQYTAENKEQLARTPDFWIDGLDRLRRGTFVLWPDSWVVDDVGRSVWSPTEMVGRYFQRPESLMLPPRYTPGPNDWTVEMRNAPGIRCCFPEENSALRAATALNRLTRSEATLYCYIETYSNLSGLEAFAARHSAKEPV